MLTVAVLAAMVAPHAEAETRPDPAPVPGATATSVAPGTALAKQLACTYNPPTLHAGSGPHTVWSGSQGEMVKVTNYVQKITGSCGISVRAATNWSCTKFLADANCGAELTHWVREDGVGDWSITVYDCTPGNSCFGSSGPDGEHTTYSAWHAASSGELYQAHVDIDQVTVVGRTSLSNHHSASGWMTS